jgi:hypothetical protein
MRGGGSCGQASFLQLDVSDEGVLVGGEKQVPFDFAQGRLSRDTAALGMTKFFWARSFYRQTKSSRV